MTKEKKIIIGMTIILILLITIFSYFLINKNAIIEKQAEEIELQAMETNGSNSYVTTQEHLNELKNKPEINTIPIEVLLNTTKTSEVTTTSDGFIYVWANRGYTPRLLRISINGVEKINYSVVNNSNPLRQILLFSKGDVITVSNTTNLGDEYVGIYYFK